MITKIKKLVHQTVKRLLSIPQVSSERIQLANTNFVLITNNCWGNRLYKTLNRPYNSPFIGLFLKPPCFLKAVKNIHNLPTRIERFTYDSKYSRVETSYHIGKIKNDVEVQYIHKKSEAEEGEKW